MNQPQLLPHPPLHVVIAELRAALTRGTSQYSTAYLMTEALHYLQVLADPFDLSETQDRVTAFQCALDDWLGPAEARRIEELYEPHEPSGPDSQVK